MKMSCQNFVLTELYPLYLMAKEGSDAMETDWRLRPEHLRRAHAASDSMAPNYTNATPAGSRQKTHRYKK